MGKFCTNCGQAVPAGSRFCGACGQPAAAPSAPPAQGHAAAPPPPQNTAPTHSQPPAQSDPAPPVHAAHGTERFIGVLPGLSRRKGLLGSEIFNAVVTDNRIIFAQQTNRMIQEEARAKGGGFLANMAGAMTAGFNIWKRYLEMPPEQALQETPGNFALAMNQIRRIKYEGGKILYRKGGFSIGLNMGDDDDDKPAKLEIETIAEKLKFEVANYFQPEVGETLKKAGLIK